MALTGFIKADENAVKSANNSFSISMGTSPFQHGIEFTVSGFTYKQAENDGKVAKDAYLNPILETSVGDLFLSTVLKSRVNSEGKVVTPNGSFNIAVRETIAKMSGKSNGEILTAIVGLCKDKEIVVERVPYAAKSKDGRAYAASLVVLNFKD